MSSSACSSPSLPPLLPPPNLAYLKSYPYLFVRETDQTDYFCTLCDAYLKEDDLQTHLFEDHRADNVEDFFVRVADAAFASSLHICVVCWAKIPQLSDARAHRRSCRVDPGEEDLENGAVPMGRRSSISCTPDIANIMNGFDHSSSGPAVKRGRKKATAAPFAPSPQCTQCCLCSTVVPSQGFPIHLREFHRVSCPLLDQPVSCPLCMSPVAVVDLTGHLSSAHGFVPQSAVNAILLWVLSSSSSATISPSNDRTGSKFKADPFPFNHQSKLNRLLTSPPKAFKSESNNHNYLASLTNGHSSAAAASAQIPTVLQTLLSKGIEPPTNLAPQANLAAVETIVSKFTRCHFVANGKESIQCLICSKWFAVPPVKHLRGHMVIFKEEKRRIVPLIGGCQVCIICYDVFDSVVNANNHLFHRHDIVVPADPSSSPPNDDGGYADNNGQYDSAGNELPTVIDLPVSAGGSGGLRGKNKVELDNAGRVKSGKVRKQCELCGEWSNIKWFFKHMSEIHQALFCRCCREYLPIHEHEEHKRWHSEPPYMGQKIRIEAGQPVIIDRKERASLTPIGSLASWGGSSGGKVVKAVDTGPSTSKGKKRKAAPAEHSPTMTPTKSMLSSPGSASQQGGLIGHMDYGDLSKGSSGIKDTLMPKEICPVCGILITYKNLARHIKLRHKIKYKFCHKCRKLVPNTTYEDHKNTCNEIVIDGSSSHMQELSSNDEDLKSSDAIDPTDFLDASSPIAEDISEDMEDSNGELMMDTRKSEEFRANTSKNKLESLMGKEFKHPRRRCAICGYSVSYSNFKRHLRNAHPAQYQECETGSGDFKKALACLSHEIGEDDRALLGHAMDDDYEATDEEDDSNEDEVQATGGSLVECDKCGDRIMPEYLDRHLKMNHAGDESDADVDDEDGTSVDKRECPVCQESLHADEVLRHCKQEHGEAYRWCERCRKYIPKKDSKLHDRREHRDHPSADEENRRDLRSNDKKELVILSDDDDVTVRMRDKREHELLSDEEDKRKKKKVFNCPECNHLFLAESSYENHMREAHRPKTEDDVQDAVVAPPAAADDDDDSGDKALEVLPSAEEAKKLLSDEILKD